MKYLPKAIYVISNSLRKSDDFACSLRRKRKKLALIRLKGLHHLDCVGLKHFFNSVVEPVETIPPPLPQNRDFCKAGAHFA
jgi:hypothetical protein